MLSTRGAARLLALLLVLFSLTAGFVMRPANAGVCTRCLLAGDVEGSGIIPDPTKLIFNGTFEGLEQAGNSIRQVTYTTHMKARIISDGAGFTGDGVLELRGAGRGVEYLIPVQISTDTDGSNLLLTLASSDSGGTLPDTIAVSDDAPTTANIESARLLGAFTESTTSARYFDVGGSALFER